MEQKEEMHRQGDIRAYLIPDEDALNPFEDWDTLGTLVTWHRDYDFGGENGREEYGEPSDFEAMAKKENLAYLPLYIYDHSGITIKTTPFSCPWDSGQIGFVYVKQEKWDDEYKDVEGTREELEEKTLKNLRCEVEALDQYLTGDVWGVVIEKKIVCKECGDVTAEDIDSCWGFFGRAYAEQECERMFESAKELKEEVAS